MPLLGLTIPHKHSQMKYYTLAQSMQKYGRDGESVINVRCSLCTPCSLIQARPLAVAGPLKPLSV